MKFNYDTNESTDEYNYRNIVSKALFVQDKFQSHGPVFAVGVYLILLGDLRHLDG